MTGFQLVSAAPATFVHVMDAETLHLTTHLVVAWAINLGTTQHQDKVDPYLTAAATPICPGRQTIYPPYAIMLADGKVETDRGEVFESVVYWREAVKQQKVPK